MLTFTATGSGDRVRPLSFIILSERHPFVISNFFFSPRKRTRGNQRLHGWQLNSPLSWFKLTDTFHVSAVSRVQFRDKTQSLISTGCCRRAETSCLKYTARVQSGARIRVDRVHVLSSSVQHRVSSRNFIQTYRRNYTARNMSHDPKSAVKGLNTPRVMRGAWRRGC